MATTLVLNSSDWTITTFYGGHALGRSYEINIPGLGKKVITEEEFLKFFESIPDRTN